MFEYFYNEILRRTIIAFGSLYNGMSSTHTDASDATVGVMRVPLACLLYTSPSHREEEESRMQSSGFI